MQAISPLNYSQTTSRILMSPPDSFSYNDQTAQTNLFQNKIEMLNAKNSAQLEFESVINILKKNGVETLVLTRDPSLILPDAVFPNNWFSTFYVNGKRTLILYPMLTLNRRSERDTEILLKLLYAHHIDIAEVIDLTYYEIDDKALEGTGSLVIDYAHQLAFAALSPRTNPFVLDTFIKISGYQTIRFHAFDQSDRLIYHTNVMMSIGKHFTVICSDAIRDNHERQLVTNTLQNLGKYLINISETQVHHFCGNILEVRSTRGEALIVMSNTAFDSFTSSQKEDLNRYGTLITVSIPTIETIGGGGVRCMMAEIF